MQKRKIKKGKIMQIVIDIDEKIIKEAKESPNYYQTYQFETIWKSICNGTVLPKHGRLIDVDANLECIDDPYEYDYWNKADVILEATKE